MRETVQHLLAGSKKIAGTEYKRRYDNSLNVLPLKCTIDNSLQPEGTKWYTENQGRGKMIESNGKMLQWE